MIHHSTCYFGGQIVTIAAGHDKTKFFLHKEVFCHENRKYYELFDQSFKETGTEYLELPEADSWVFSTIVEWSYSTFACNYCCEDSWTSSNLDLATCIEIYIVAHKYHLEEFHDFIIDNKLYSKLSKTTISDDKKAFERFNSGVPETSPLHELTVRSMAYHMISQLPLAVVAKMVTFCRAMIDNPPAQETKWTILWTLCQIICAVPSSKQQ